jgi:hypothetical protein
MNNSRRIAVIEREFFGILDEFFLRATGSNPTEFATFDSFGTTVRREAQKLGTRGPDAYSYAYQALSAFYKSNGIELFREAKKLGGLNFVLGGSSRFLESQFASVRKVVLYADTVLIPDPILPWIENPRAEERFRNVLFLQSAFVLLHLKPLVDADLPYPAVIVFPSYEKSLEKLDPTTQTRINDLATGILSLNLGREFAGFEELTAFAETNEGDFLRGVDDHHLFVAPGGNADQSLEDALKAYLEYTKEWRSEDYLLRLSNLPKGILVLNALMERIAPQYHLFENAEELSSCPMLCLPVQWHYYSIACRFFEQRLKSRGILDETTINTVRGINQPELKWLGNIPVEALVDLRRNNENEEFRRILKARISELHGAALSDLNRVTSEVSRSIASLLARHDKQIAEIENKYQSKYRKIAVGSWATVAALLVPALGPIVGVGAPLAIGATYLGAKLDERKERANASKSLMGILAAASEEE